MNETHRGAEGSATTSEFQTIDVRRASDPGRGRRREGGAEMDVETQRPIGLT
jgi:hypothetical protein